ncbi:MAG: acylphosphatase [Chloroflexi bacterium]|nr:acylphosphatase [Chloroflexota bacterium]MCI0577875.1 acylphosphatase [Chloroflexota bacterium]MCI0644489.1 acylphosphatase [Chloroflexota bacterium]MCI0730243.1 acylphosphatase [Chloroflexota bacterium]
MKRLTATVHGRVQGVSFRYYTRLEAQRLGLVGWVRNERDGSVSIVAEGQEAELQRLANFLHHGPQGARVAQVEIAWSPATHEFQSFEVRWL